MKEEIDLVAELAIILIAAGVFTVISKWLKQPLILGYIVAGFLVGPHLGLIPQMGGKEVIDQWSEIGIIFMLFALGLEFSFKKLLKVGSSALIMAGTICIGMLITGNVAGHLMGWTHMECIFLGGLLSMSSTTIIIKAFDDMGLKKKPFAGVVFGALVIEDLIAVLLMVLLSTMAVSNKFAGGEMIWNLTKLVFYIAIWFLFGIFIIPTLLKKAKPYLNNEILLVLAVGMCFGMVALAEAAGFSSALGAFVMGSILAETIEGERIEKLMVGIKDLFGAVFFVSVGMMVDPAVIGEHWLPILIIALIAVGGILVFATTGSLLAGKGLDNSLHAGFSMAQLGEFGFIIASLGCSLGVMRGFIYPVIIAVSVITTFTTPYMIKAADPVSAWLHKVLPAKVLEKLSPVVETKKSSAEASLWARFLKLQGIRILIYLVVLIALGLITDAFLPKLLDRFLPSGRILLKEFIMLTATLVVMSPFLYSMAFPNSKMKSMAKELVGKKASYKWPVIALDILRHMICLAIISTEILAYITSRSMALPLVALSIVVVIIFIIFGKNRKIDVEGRFFSNLNAKEEQERRQKPVASYIKETLEGYDIQIVRYVVPHEFAFAGKTLREMPFRKSSGVNIIRITRGNIVIPIPSGDEAVFPGDELSVVGTTQQLELFNSIMEENTSAATKDNGYKVYIDKITLSKTSPLYGNTLRELNMRSSKCMVISVMRDGSLIANPKPDFRFEEGDMVWIAGDEASCKWYE